MSELNITTTRRIVRVTLRQVGAAAGESTPKIVRVGFGSLASSGDMTKAVYDPQEIEGDAFDRANHAGTQSATSITEDSTHRFTTDAEKAIWNAKQAALGFTPENTANKSSDVNADQDSNTKYASVKAVYDWVISQINSLFPSITDTGGNVTIDTGTSQFRAGDLSGIGNGSALIINDGDSSVSLSTTDGGGDFSAAISASADAAEEISTFTMSAATPNETLQIKMQTDLNTIELSAATGNIVLVNLPTSNPNIAGAIWNDSGTLKISAG